MLALLALGIGVLAGRLGGGRLAGLAEMGLRRTPLVVIGLGTLAVLQLGPPDLRRGLAHVVLLGTSYALVVVFLWSNRSMGPLRLVAVGVLLNLVVIIPNGGMPVSRRATTVVGIPDPRENPAVLGGKHVIAGPRTVLRPLGDVIPLPVPGIDEAVSVGDLIVLAGIGWLVAQSMRRARTLVRAS